MVEQVVACMMMLANIHDFFMLKFTQTHKIKHVNRAKQRSAKLLTNPMATKNPDFSAGVLVSFSAMVSFL